MTKIKSLMALALVLALMPIAALAAGTIEAAIGQAQVTIVSTIAAAIVAVAFGLVVARIDARSKQALAKTPADRTLVDKLVIEADRRLDEIDRGHLEKIIANVLLSNMDKVASTIGLPPKQAADLFVDDFFVALDARNPGLAARLPIGAGDVKELIAAGIGRVTAPDLLAEALRKVPGVGQHVRSPV